MKMEELLSAADDLDSRGGDHDDDTLPSPSEPGPSTNTNNNTASKNKSPVISTRNSMRTRSKRDHHHPPPLAIDPDHHHDTSSQAISPSTPTTPSFPPTPTVSSTPTTTSSTTSTSSSTSTTTTSSPRVEPVLQCKTPGCVVCLKGPPPSFSKGTPIWAQILHLVLYALTESAKVNVMGSPKMKVKRYFHLRDDIYEYISIHWDVICRRERIKNWRHTIGMTLSHYQNLFQNGYHIYQNTGYWSMKDNVPSPYVIDPLIGGDGSSPGKKRKYSHSKTTGGFTDKEKDTNLTPFISDFPISSQDSTSTTSNSNDDDKNDKDYNTHHKDDNMGKSVTLPSFNTTSSSLLPSPQVLLGGSGSMTAVRFDEMKTEIDRFKREMGSLQSEIDSLQEQLQVKKAEEHLLKFLQEGISSFRDKIKQRIELLRAEMINNHSEHQQQIHNMASEMTQLREIGADLRNAFQYQFSRLVNLNAPQQHH